MAVRARLDRISRQPLSGVVFDQLLERVVSGVFRPGQALPPERQLCLELGVSRTAVREALARLAQLRLIQIRHGGETLVLDWRTTAGLDLLPALLRRANGRLDPEIARSGFEMRAAIGPDLARLAAVHRDEHIVAELTATVDAMADATDLAALAALSMRFWAALAVGSKNLAYQLAFNTLREAVRELPGLAAAQEEELRDLRGYRQIADAVRRGDGTAASRAARAHIAIGLVGIGALTRRRS
jgi:DNA-binding FadR family transcriptional regulator